MIHHSTSFYASDLKAVRVNHYPERDGEGTAWQVFLNEEMSLTLYGHSVGEIVNALRTFAIDVAAKALAANMDNDAAHKEMSEVGQ